MAFGLSAGAVALIGAGASAYIASEGAQDAAGTQAAAAGQATDAQRQMFERQVQLQEPWRQAGQTGLNKLSYLMGTANTPAFESSTANAEVERIAAEIAASKGLSAPGDAERNAAYSRVRDGWGAKVGDDFGSLLRKFGVNDFETDPGYQFRQEQGEQAMTRAAAARGGLGSGKFLKDAMRFNQGLASQEYGAAFDRYNVNNANQFNRLASVAGIGQIAANQTGAAAGNFGNQIGSNIIGAGNAMAAGRVGSANALSGAIGQGASMYQQNQLMNQFSQPSGGYRYQVPNYPGAEY